MPHVTDGCLHVAPMLAITDRHFRHLCRLLSRRAVLWTEMIHADAVRHNADAVLPYDSTQHPVVVQLGGADPSSLAHATRVCADEYGYDEVNLNCGCPSARVTSKQREEEKCFGARLMLRPAHTAECLRRMVETVDCPVSVKCRLGVDDCAEYENLVSFVEAVAADSGVRHVVVHARAALLNGIGTIANRRIPPLRYELVYRLKSDFPGLRVTLNGGIDSLEKAREVLDAGNVDGVMLGRAIQHNPLVLARVDDMLDSGTVPSAPDAARLHAALLSYRQYIDSLDASEPSEAAARKSRSRAERHLGIMPVAKALSRMEALQTLRLDST